MPAMQENLDNLKERIVALLGQDGDATAAEIEEAIPAELLEEVGYDGYREAVDAAMEEAGYPKDEEEQGYGYADPKEPKDEDGGYSPEALRDHLAMVVNETEVDNSVDVGDYGEVHYGIDQGAVTNTANANAEGAVAGQDLGGQIQTGDGNQVGDYNSGVVGVDENSGVVAGGDVWTEDVNSGENILTNEGGTVAGAFAFGDGANADDGDTTSYDNSTNDSYNQNDVGNVTESYNEDNVGNTDVNTEHTVDANLHADIDVETPYVDAKEGYGLDDGHDDHHEDDYVSD